MKTTNIFSLLEYFPMNFDEFEKAIFNAKVWEKIAPVEKISANFTAPNVLSSEMQDTITFDPTGLTKVNLLVKGDLIFEYKGVDGDKGHLYDLNVRNNNYVNKMDARLRVKSEGSTLKVGVFLQSIEFNSTLFDRGFGREAILVGIKLKLKNLLTNFANAAKNGTLYTK
ncbi:MAG: hypothetical protein RBG13Loki_2511 [Promethearchaeota archaeon CR_4]|nr:MAG: hypothetical protein RBG13Loki_2511 [Candidatus Lokiarchaeota archaeon CR_4]